MNIRYSLKRFTSYILLITLTTYDDGVPASGRLTSQCVLLTGKFISWFTAKHTSLANSSDVILKAGGRGDVCPGCFNESRAGVGYKTKVNKTFVIKCYRYRS